MKLLTIPPVKARGATRRKRDSAVQSSACCHWETLASTLPLVSVAPFGRPVVPEV